MILNVEQTIIDYLNQFGFLFENDSIVLLEDLKTEKKIQKVKEFYKKRRQELKDNRDDQIEALKDFAMDLAKDAVDEFEIENTVTRKRDQIIRAFVSKQNMLKQQEIAKINQIKSGGKLVTGMALASILIYGALKLYYSELEKANFICSSKVGKEKHKCFLKQKITSVQKRISFLDRSKVKCSESKDPVKCKDKIDEEIVRLKQKANDYFEELRTDMGIEF